MSLAYSPGFGHCVSHVGYIWGALCRPSPQQGFPFMDPHDASSHYACCAGVCGEQGQQSVPCAELQWRALQLQPASSDSSGQCWCGRLLCCRLPACLPSRIQPAGHSSNYCCRNMLLFVWEASWVLRTNLGANRQRLCSAVLAVPA